MDPITLMLILGGGLLLMSGKKKGKRRTNLPPGHYDLEAGIEYTLLLPRASGYWTSIPIGGTPGSVRIYNSPGDALELSRVEGVNAGPVVVKYFANPDKTDLVAEYSFNVVGGRAVTRRPAGVASLATS